MPNQLFFSKDINPEMCYRKSYFLDKMTELMLSEIVLYKAVRELKSIMFYCKEIGDIGEKNDFCSKICGLYAPRNGKSGCCKHRGYVYGPGEKFTLNINGKLTPIK